MRGTASVHPEQSSKSGALASPLGNQPSTAFSAASPRTNPQRDDESGASPCASAVFTAERLVGRLDQVRQLGRRRRLRIQLPLGALGMLVSIVSVVASYSMHWAAWGGLGMALGPWLLLFCVMPTDARGIGFSLGVVGVLICVAVGGRLLSLSNVLSRGCATVSATTCTTFVGATSYGIGWLLLHLGYVVYVGVGLFGAVFGLPALPSVPPRTALNSLWKCAGSVLLGYAPYFLVVSAESMRVQTDLVFDDEYERAFSINARAAVRLALGIEIAILGLLALWPGLRVHAQSRLASMGEGVAAAAGIAGLIVGCESVMLTEIARDTFRSVRLDKLQPHHLRTALRDGGKSTYALSTPASLGSIDAFITHSWRDDPQEKYQLLQAWRSRFVKAHGREPTVWLDLCCLDTLRTTKSVTSRKVSMVACLPVYLAGCDSLLALSGPSFRSRLWCMVELFVFHEMKAPGARKIEVLHFRTPPQPSEPVAALGSVHEQPAAAQRPSPTLSAEGPSANGSARFDVRHATCTLESDRQRLIGVIEECGGGGADHFNAWIHELLSKPPDPDVHAIESATVAKPRHNAHRY